MTKVSIEREQLTAWAAILNMSASIASKHLAEPDVDCVIAEYIGNVSKDINTILYEDTRRYNELLQSVKDARKHLDESIEEHIEAQAIKEQKETREECGKDISCLACIVCGENTCERDEIESAVSDNQHCEAEPEQLPNEDAAKLEAEPAATETQNEVYEVCVVDWPLNDEKKLSRNGAVLWSEDEESVLRTFNTAQDAREKAYLPGRDAKAIDNKWRRLNAEHRIIDKSKPFRYIGENHSLKDKLGTIDKFTDDRKSANVTMTQGSLKYCQIAIRNISQEGLL